MQHEWSIHVVHMMRKSGFCFLSVSILLRLRQLLLQVQLQMQIKEKGGLNVQKAVNLTCRCLPPGPGGGKSGSSLCTVPVLMYVTRQLKLYKCTVPLAASVYSCCHIVAWSGTVCGVPQEMFPQFR